MSFDINWDKLVSDNAVNETVKEFLDQQFNSISLPSFIDNLSVTNFSLGNIPPEITIRHVGDPFDEFYHEENSEDEEKKGTPAMPSGFSDDEESEDEHMETTLHEAANRERLQNIVPITGFDNTSRKSLDILKHFHNYNMNNVGLGNHLYGSQGNDSETPTNIFSHNLYSFHQSSAPRNETKKSESDLQLILEIDYHGDISLELTVNLLVNYPSSSFITLPIKLRITDLVVHSLAAVAYLEKSVFVSFLCDVNDTSSDYFTSSNVSGHTTEGSGNTSTSALGGNLTDYANTGNHERIDVIRNIKIESEIGELENNILRNVGKVEKFLVEQLRAIIRDEIAWPSWMCFDLSDEGPDSDGEDAESRTVNTDLVRTSPIKAKSND